jgi:hypothetical protein
MHSYTILHRVITCDETWFYQHDPEDLPVHGVVNEESPPPLPGPKKPRMSKSKIKIIFSGLFDIRCINRFEFVHEGTTDSHTFYVKVLERLIDAVRRKQGESWRDR